MSLIVEIKFHGGDTLFTGLSLVSITINKIIKIFNKKKDRRAKERKESRKGRKEGR